jgi:hypothetical protein
VPVAAPNFAHLRQDAVRFFVTFLNLARCCRSCVSTRTKARIAQSRPSILGSRKCLFGPFADQLMLVLGNSSQYVDCETVGLLEVACFELNSAFHQT